MRVSRPLTAAATVTFLTAGLLAGLSGTASAADAGRDGSAYKKAAASCWAIKQAKPTAASGTYWLQTPKLVAPQQFYCDMETDGGGWVLVGRGRDGWSFAHNGQSTATQVRSVVNGPSAFAPAALSASVIDGLLNGNSPTTLTDGVRVRRAANSTGTSWQELRYKTTMAGPWSWAFGGGIPLSSYSMNGVANTNAGITTRDVSLNGDNGTRAFTYQLRSHLYRAGFAYGSTVSGVNNSTSYLWQATTEKLALPFAQMWLRPKLVDLTYPVPGPEGAPATAQRPMMDIRTSTTTPWGVTGVVGGGTGETNIEVQALAPMGDSMYVGGKFEYVQKGAAPAAADKVRQPYIAAFDVTTGEWKSGFRPQLNGQVWDIQPTPDGKLILAGEFTSVNGVAGTAGLAAVDPATGAVLSSWRASLKHNTLTSMRGRALDIQGDWVYVGGGFTSVSGGVVTPRTLTLRNATRVRVSDGMPDPVWKPTFNGQVMELDASDAGDRVYLVGQFRKDADLNYTQANNVAVLSTSGKGALVPGLKAYVPSTTTTSNQYQQTIREIGGAVWQGGSQHNLHKYNRDTYDLIRSHITKQGGDLQAMVEIDGIVYAACHCEHYTYTDARSWSGDPLPPSYSRVDPVLWVGAWDAATGDYLPEFAISGLRSRAGNGPWEVVKDRNNCMWFGGDMRQGSYAGTRYQWLGGFGKVCPRDSTAPTAPSGLRATRTSTGVNLAWTGSTDNVRVQNYEVIRDDRVLVSPTGTTLTDTGAPANVTYWVRAVDAAGNRSATTTAVVVP